MERRGLDSLKRALFGFAVAAAVYGLVVIQLGKTVVVINITDPDITVSIAEQGNKIEILTGPRESKIEVQPGEQELKISYAGLEARTQKFELKKGQQRRVTVSIVNKELVATLDQQSLSLIESSEKATSATPTSPKNDSAKLAAIAARRRTRQNQPHHRRRPPLPAFRSPRPPATSSCPCSTAAIWRAGKPIPASRGMARRKRRADRLGTRSQPSLHRARRLRRFSSPRRSPHQREGQ